MRKGHYKGKIFIKGQAAWNKGELLSLSCQKCSKVFQVQPHRKAAKFCSILCSNQQSKKPRRGITRKCLECQKEFYIPKAHAYRIYCSQNCAKVVHIGRKPANYLVDRTLLKKGDHQHKSPAYKEWMLSVKNRDGWKCKISNGDCSGRLEAHHILTWRSHPELRYEINNGITLCLKHHPRSRKMEIELVPYFRGILDKVNF